MNPRPVFDVVREMLGRGFRQSEVQALDRALAEALEESGENIRKNTAPCAPSRRIGPTGLQLVKRFEGCARKRPDELVEAYPDPGSTDGHPWTIGWGATGPDHFNGSSIGPATVWTQQQCDERLESDLHKYAAEVSQAIGDCPTAQNQFDALVSFHYNTGAIGRATLTRMHRRGDHIGAAREFARWVHNDGKVMKGLRKRRQAEAELYRMSVD